jgi:hypothetical protein
MAGAAVVTAQFIAGKSVRDALYLAQLDVTSLPAMIAVASAVSLGLVAISSIALRRVAPATFVPLIFLISATLFVGEWALALSNPRLAAPVVYLHISGLGPLLGSGFWLIATERFDPHTAKRRFGQIAGVGTLGGLAGGLLAERVAAQAGGVTMMLPVLAAINVLCAWQTRQLTPEAGRRVVPLASDAAAEIAPEAPRSGLRALAVAPYLRSLAALVMLGTIAAAPIDYLFKAQAVATLGRGDGLLRFFAIYYAATSAITFVIQTGLSRPALERLGLAFVAASPSVTVFAGSVGAFFSPGLASTTIVRGGESVFRSSLFKSGYELFYTPLAAKERRAAKSLIDVGFDRIGDAAGAGLIRAVIVLMPALQETSLLLVAIGCSALALVVASRLNRGYLHTLERSLRNRAVELDLSDVRDLTTRTVMLRTLGPRSSAVLKSKRPATRASDVEPELSDPVLADIAALRSRDRAQVLGILRRDAPLPGVLIPHVIPLLAWDPVAEDAIAAMRRSADMHVGAFIDALVDPDQPFAVRRRLPRALAHCVSQRAADGLVLGLDDMRFEVRFRCGRTLTAIRERNPDVQIARSRLLDVVKREVGTSRPVWESHRLLDEVDPEAQALDRFVKDRASQSLAHVFTLLALAFPAEPLRLAFRGLHSEDQALRGTALEYLESIIPAAIREALWPFLDDDRKMRPAERSREEVLAELMRLHQSMVLGPDDLKSRAKQET